MKNKLILLLILVALPWQISQASVEREEHISDYHSNITINPDASLDITEKTTTYDNGRHGRKPGYYTTTSTTHHAHAVRLLNTSDQLDWNIPGNNHELAILKSQIDIHLPKGAKMLSQRSNGTQHSQAHTRTTQEANQLTIASDYLSPGAAIHIALDWSKGFVHLPTPGAPIQIHPVVNKASPRPIATPHKLTFTNQQAWLVAIGTCMVLIGVLGWLYLNRRTLHNAIIPVFDPPQRLSPAALRFIMQRRFDKKTLTAAIISMATKRFLVIQNDYDDYTLTKIDDDDSALSMDEAALAKILFAENAVAHLSANAAHELKAAHRKFKTILKEAHRYIYFSRILRRSTAEGRALHQQVQGFKLYLSTTDRKRLASLHPPQPTPALFEKYLPYAIALNVEAQWSAIFNDTLQQGGHGNYYPSWYSGMWTGSNFATLSHI